MNNIKIMDLLEMADSLRDNLGLVTCARLALTEYAEDTIAGRIVDALYIAENNIEEKLEELDTVIKELKDVANE